MKLSDRALGMNRAITRRDFVNGLTAATARSLLPVAWQHARAVQDAPAIAADSYPPRRTGLRGSHPGSFEVAHRLRDQHGWDLGGAVNTGEEYDLVVVGGGISGLSASHFFLKRLRGNARVLILDNHDDFGGHAKRNEFRYAGRLLALNGGTLNIESPLRYNTPAREILRDIGIDLDRYVAANAKNRTLYESLGLKEAYFFDRETWGRDSLVLGAADERTGSRRAFSLRARSRPQRGEISSASTTRRSQIISKASPKQRKSCGSRA